MFNLIKGEMINRSSSPVLIKGGEKKEVTEKRDELNGELLSIKEEIAEKRIILLGLIDEIEQKEKEYQNIEAVIAGKLDEEQVKIDRMYSEAEEKIEYEISTNRNLGFQEGYQQGVEAGKEEGIATAADLIRRCEDILSQAIERKERAFSENENEIIDLAFKIAEKIIKKSVDNDKETIRRVLREALKKVPVSKKLTIIVNLDDLDHIKEIKQKLFSEIHGVENIEIIEDSSIERGGCILETSIGTINATIKSQLETLFEKLMENKQNES